MGVQVTWDNEAHTILHYKMEGRWRWNELYAAVEEGHILNDDPSQEVYAIVNLERSLGIPPSAMTQFGGLATLTRPNTKVVIIVGGGGFVSTLIKIFSRIYQGVGVHTCWVATMAEAYALIVRDPGDSVRAPM